MKGKRFRVVICCRMELAHLAGFDWGQRVGTARRALAVWTWSQLGDWVCRGWGLGGLAGSREEKGSRVELVHGVGFGPRVKGERFSNF
jgi:hypothetical protein